MPHTFSEVTYSLDVSRLRLRCLRKFLRLTQNEWAEKLRIHRPAVTLIEDGRQRLTLMQLLVILDMTQGTDVRWLLGLDLWSDRGTVPAPYWWENPRTEYSEEWLRCEKLEEEYRNRGKKKGGKKL